jgi:hypothetical protein
MRAQQGLRLPVGSRFVAATLAAGLAVVGLAGCDSNAVALNAQSATSLHEKVAAVRAAADNHDRTAAVAAVDAFRAEVWRLVEDGGLSKTDAAALLAHADAVAADVLDSVVALPTPSPTPTPEATPAPTPLPTMSPAQVDALRQETADRLTAMLQERLGDYVKQRMAEQKAEEKAARHKGKGASR